MEIIFRDDFSGVELYNWKKEQHVPDGYPDFVIRDGALVMFDAGNRLIPAAPILKNFSIKGAFDTEWKANDNKFSLQIYFDYDRDRRQGTILDFSSDGNELTVSLSDGNRLIVKEKVDKKFLADIIRKRFVEFEVRMNNDELLLFLDSGKCFSHKVDRTAGIIALGRGVFIGELRMKSFEIASDDKLEKQIIWDRLAIPFEPINGMDNSIIWTVSAWKTGEIVRMDVELSGGCVDRENIEWFVYHCRYVEELTAPYLRIESSVKDTELTLTQKALALCHQPQKFFYLFGSEKPEWPFKKSFFLDSLDHENAVLFCGYKTYRSKSINKHQAAGQCETAYDCKSGKIVYYGDALKPGTVTVDLKSPVDKQICKDIPESTREYEKALRFARENHYFSENEGCCFHFELFSRMGGAKNELRLEYCLQDAFFEPLGKYKDIRLKEKSETVILDMEKICSENITFKKLKSGVYHLAFRLLQGNVPLQEKYRAFEVYSKKLSGPEASGLPKMFSFSTEAMGSDTDYFDPWKSGCVDVSHYISIGVSVMPHFAREKRLWELYRLYHREWFLWLTSRTTKEWDLDKNHDLVEHCDYLQSPNALGEVSLFRLCARGFYRGTVIEILYEFALKNNFHAQAIKNCIDEKSPLGKDVFNELVEKNFYQWADFFCDKFTDMMRRKKNQIAEINANAKYSDYGPVAIYAAAYKTAHSTRYVGGLKHSKEIEDIYDGFFIFEDYPHCSRYSINRGPFLLASIKMEFPKWKIYPEMYVPFNEPCLDDAVARPWPSVGMWQGDFSVNCSVKKALEYVYAAVWHDGDNFKYWEDHGFETRIWERERYESLLKTWGFVSKAKAAHPLKANAFICNDACCENHKVFYDEYPGGEHEALGDLFNTAEESIAYAYEMSRSAGQNAGFVADFKSLKKLNAADIDTLVLPPLTKVNEKDLAWIRRLHEQGVTLLAFEEVAGLEDLFGVKEDGMKQVNNITVNKNLPTNPLMKMSGLTEYAGHRACRGKYRSDGADVLLEGEIPVLFTNKTRWGKTALFNIPPTTVRREDQFHRVCYGRDSISTLINESTKLVLKYLSNPTVETDAGKIIAFNDTKGDTHIIVEEDAHPFPAATITPLVSIYLPGLKKRNISCDKEFSIVSITEKSAKIRLKLAPDEFAILTLN